jgi:hypothetical protein
LTHISAQQGIRNLQYPAKTFRNFPITITRGSQYAMFMQLLYNRGENL